MVPPEEQAQTIQNFKIEAKILWGLNHPNLPSVTGFFTENQRYFLVMEYIDGFTLEDLLERNGAPFSERRVLGWARQLCDVLEYLHSQNPPIIFRDMKPGNVMLTRDGRIKLIDFGIARFFRPTIAQDTQQLGTPGFAPPEQYGKSQTDERSDIYSLAITLFQLLTNELHDGFGLKDVRITNAQISPVVARALEKATALQPEERYESVAAFRRALLGVGTFVFENDDVATTPEELADLCARYPEEASEYLAAGEIESWLREIGETDLARAAQHIRTTMSDPDDPLLAVERFLQTVIGPQAHIHGYLPTNQSSGQSGSSATSKSSQSGRTWFSRKAPPPVQVSPRTLDFGSVYPGLSASLAITITGNQGRHVSGTVQPIEPWIIVDQAHFDGMSTRINVRVNSAQLHTAAHYTGTILVTPDGEEEQKDILVVVEADVINYAPQNIGTRRRVKTHVADLDEDDEDDEALTSGAMIMAPPVTRTAEGQSGLPTSAHTRDKENKTKYGQPGDTASVGWDPLQYTSSMQRTRLQYTLAFLTAFMLASFFYTLVSQLPPLLNQSPLPPNPWFIFVLSGMVPAATLGATLVQWNTGWNLKETLNRLCTGMGASLLALALIKILWQLLLHADLAPLQLVVMLLAAAIGATIGTSPSMSDRILYGASWALAHMRWFVIVIAMILGGALGYFLTAGLAVGCFTPFGIVIGIGVVAALILRVDHLMQRRQRP